MKPVDFDLHRPATLDVALALLASHGDDARVLAGGQGLVPLLNFRLARIMSWTSGAWPGSANCATRRTGS